MMPSTRSILPSENKSFSNLGASDRFLREMKCIHDEIERAAFHHFQKRGSTHGESLSDWLRAESELLDPVTVSIKDNQDAVIVTAKVPGFSMDEIKMRVEGNQLLICGRSNGSQPSNAKSGKMKVSSSRKIFCTISLPSAVISEQASGTVDKGILTLTLPKAQPKAIPAKAA